MVPKSQWIQYYKHLWTEKDINGGDDREDLLRTETKDENMVNITMIKLEEVLKKDKESKKAQIQIIYIWNYLNMEEMN